MTVPFKVYGHPRSGNHFLAAFLAENLVFDEDLSLTVERPQTGHWSRREEPALYRTPGGTARTEGPVTVPYGRLLGGHGFSPAANSVYVFRDGRDVALSIYRWTKFRSRADEGLSFSEWLRKPLDWHSSPGQKSARCFTIAEHWHTHLASWWHGAYGAVRLDAVRQVRYEALLTDPEERQQLLVDLAARYDLERRYDEPLMPTGVGWEPSQDFSTGRWQSAMEPADADYFCRVVDALSVSSPGGFYGLWG